MWKVCTWVGLDAEKILRITQVLLQIGRELTQVLENPRKRTPINRQHGIVGIHDIEENRAVVHVHDHLHGIADVVQSSLPRPIRVRICE